MVNHQYGSVQMCAKRNNMTQIEHKNLLVQSYQLLKHVINLRSLNDVNGMLLRADEAILGQDARTSIPVVLRYGEHAE